MIPPRLLNAAKGRNVSIALALWIGFAVLFFNFGPYSILQTKAGGSLLEEKFGYSKTEAQEQFRRLGEEGRSAYRNFQLLDTVNAVFMAVALAFSLAFALSRLCAARNPLRLLVYLPILAAIVELAENSLLFTFVSTFPSEAALAGSIASPVTSIKLVLGFAVFPVALVSFLALGIKTLYNRSRE